MATDSAIQLLRQLAPYWKHREEWNAGELNFHYKDHPAAFSGRFLSDMLVGYLALAQVGKEERWLRNIKGLLRPIARRQDASGAFRWNLPDPYATHRDGVQDQVDLCMVLDAIHNLIASGLLDAEGLSIAHSISEKGILHLQAMEHPLHPGIIRKRVYETGFTLGLDVLNGDAMAAKAFFQAGLLHHAERFLDHLQARFGKHYPGWWPYCESLQDQNPDRHPGWSVLFQSMMVVHLYPVICHPRFECYRPMVAEAAKTIDACIRADGSLNEVWESRSECIGKPNALIAHCLMLQDPASPKAQKYLTRIQDSQITKAGDVHDRAGNESCDKWRIWLFSDLGRLSIGLSGTLE